MALIIADRIKETTTTTGTGTYTLAGAADGFESFAEIGDGNTTYYVCAAGTDFEVGIGTYTASGTTLARTTILQSSNSDAAVDWAAGEKNIFCTVPAEKYVFKDASGNTALAGDLTFGDNDKAIFGAGSDLQIYHDGSDSIISDQGTGDLKFEVNRFLVNNSTDTENMILATPNGAVRLYYDGSPKFDTTATGVDVTGTVTADGLTVDGATVIQSGAAAADVALSVGSSGTAGKQKFYAGGDVAFTEDTGTTEKFFWDASAESLGIGTTSTSSEKLRLKQSTDSSLGGLVIESSDAYSAFMGREAGSTGAFTIRNNGSDTLSIKSGNVGIGTSSPSQAMHIYSSGTDARLRIEAAGTNGEASIELYNDASAFTVRIDDDDSFRIRDTDGAGERDRLVIDGAGNVGIGTISPDRPLEVVATNTTMKITGSGVSSTGIVFETNGVERKQIGIPSGDTALAFYSDAGSTEAMRIDSSGNLLVGKTSTAIGTVGFRVDGANGFATITRDGYESLILNRKTSDGDIAKFQKDGTTVGSIGGHTSGVVGLSLRGGSSYGGIGLPNDRNTIWPINSSSAPSDNYMDIGSSAVRFKDLYLSGSIDAGGPIEISATNPNIRLFESDTTNLNTQLNQNIGKFSILTTNDAATSGSTRFEIDHSTGDISFYSSSGNADLVWDASSSNLLMSDAGTITKASQTADTSSMYIGTNAGIDMGNTATLENNTFVGNYAGQNAETATNCTAIGYEAFHSGFAASGVTAVGYKACYNQTGSYVTAVGYQSGPQESSGVGAAYNTSIGAFAGDVLTTGDDNVCVGYGADLLGSGNSDSVVVGYTAKAGTYSVSIGHRAQLSGVSTSNYCVTIGRESGYDLDGSDFCTFVGYRSGYAGGTANYNAGFGPYSLDGLSSGYHNTACGAAAGGQVSTGYYNTSIGYSAGYNDTTTFENTSLGGLAGNSESGASNCTQVGYNSQSAGSTSVNQVTLGDSRISVLRCNQTSISSLSDERDKTAIEDIPYGLDFINAMRPVQFTWNRRDGSMGATKDIGFIAQELAEVEMDFSSTGRTRMVSFENPEKWEAAPNRTYPILIKAVQELSAKCEALEARIQQLEQGN